MYDILFVTTIWPLYKKCSSLHKILHLLWSSSLWQVVRRAEWIEALAEAEAPQLDLGYLLFIGYCIHPYICIIILYTYTVFVRSAGWPAALDGAPSLELGYLRVIVYICTYVHCHIHIFIHAQNISIFNFYLLLLRIECMYLGWKIE